MVTKSAKSVLSDQVKQNRDEIKTLIDKAYKLANDIALISERDKYLTDEILELKNSISRIQTNFGPRIEKNTDAINIYNIRKESQDKAKQEKKAFWQFKLE